MKAVGEGGRQERAIAERYQEWARELDLQWPETASLLREMAQERGAEAAHEDVTAAVDRDEYDIETVARDAVASLPEVERALHSVITSLPNEVERLAYIQDVDPGGENTLVVYVLLRHSRDSTSKRDVEALVRQALEGVVKLSVHCRWRTAEEHDQLNARSDNRRALDVRR